MFCPSCGTRNLDHARFCAGCGCAIGSPQSRPATGAAPWTGERTNWPLIGGVVSYHLSCITAGVQSAGDSNLLLVVALGLLGWGFVIGRRSHVQLLAAAGGLALMIVWGGWAPMVPSVVSGAAGLVAWLRSRSPEPL